MANRVGMCCEHLEGGLPMIGKGSAEGLEGFILWTQDEEGICINQKPDYIYIRELSVVDSRLDPRRLPAPFPHLIVPINLPPSAGVGRSMHGAPEEAYLDRVQECPIE